MIQLLLLLTVTSQCNISITDMQGFPVTGASICTGSTLIDISDADGTAAVPVGTDSLEVRALGYATWKGRVPPTGRILLTSVPVPSGTVISVTTERSGFRDYFPATTILDKKDMQQIGTTGLGTLNTRCGGIFVREYGGAMPVISISIRGSDAAHSGYYIDGHNITSAMDALPGMTLNPLIFGAMEISRGGGSAFQKGGMAGTLNFVTESPGLPSIASLTSGTDGSIAVSGGFSAGHNRFSLSVRRLTGIHESAGYDGEILFHGSNRRFLYGLLSSVSSGQTESPDWSTPTDATRERFSIDGWGRWNYGKLRLSADFRTGRLKYSSTLPVHIDDTHDNLSGIFGFEYYFPVSILHPHFSAASSFEQVWSTSLGRRDRLTLEASLTAGYSGCFSALTSVSMNAVPSQSPMSGYLLSAGLPVRDSLLLIHASASTNFRRPSLNDLYWPEDNFALGNKDLLPETSIEFEGGVSLYGIQNMKLSTTCFIAESKNLIRWEPGENGKWSPVNIAGALRRGIESEAWFSAGILDVTATMTLLNVKDNCRESVNFGSVLPYTPDYTYGIEAVVNYPYWSLWSVSAAGMGIRFKNYSETSWLPPYTVFSTGLEVQPEFMGIFSLNVSVRNLFNEDYQETNGYTGRSRTYYFGLKLKGN